MFDCQLPMLDAYICNFAAEAYVLVCWIANLVFETPISPGWFPIIEYPAWSKPNMPPNSDSCWTPNTSSLIETLQAATKLKDVEQLKAGANSGIWPWYLTRQTYQQWRGYIDDHMGVLPAANRIKNCPMPRLGSREHLEETLVSSRKIHG